MTQSFFGGARVTIRHVPAIRAGLKRERRIWRIRLCVCKNAGKVMLRRQFEAAQLTARERALLAALGAFEL